MKSRSNKSLDPVTAQDYNLDVKLSTESTFVRASRAHSATKHTTSSRAHKPRSTPSSDGASGETTFIPSEFGGSAESQMNHSISQSSPSTPREDPTDVVSFLAQLRHLNPELAQQVMVTMKTKRAAADQLSEAAPTRSDTAGPTAGGLILPLTDDQIVVPLPRAQSQLQLAAPIAERELIGEMHQEPQSGAAGNEETVTGRGPAPLQHIKLEPQGELRADEEALRMRRQRAVRAALPSVLQTPRITYPEPALPPALGPWGQEQRQVRQHRRRGRAPPPARPDVEMFSESSDEREESPPPARTPTPEPWDRGRPAAPDEAPPPEPSTEPSATPAQSAVVTATLIATLPKLTIGSGGLTRLAWAEFRRAVERHEDGTTAVVFYDKCLSRKVLSMLGYIAGFPYTRLGHVDFIEAIERSFPLVEVEDIVNRVEEAWPHSKKVTTQRQALDYFARVEDVLFGFHWSSLEIDHRRQILKSMLRGCGPALRASCESKITPRRPRTHSAGW
eukprot:gnl/Dysnectes_brevis/2667_a3228_921.p1 GENE.gnl/Dysnectes_brevis/2667_a3228_921~~gnl/Dysnectes_brevis/2667_a3228_921.p1  ORF type:complete len:504 (-),score=72.31 gnl/Dysnectes_brevis/2667_a3228_921:305-1816(-)